MLRVVYIQMQNFVIALGGGGGLQYYNVVFLINNCLGAMSILLLSGIWLLPGNYFLLTGIR